ncbi:MAG: hypothetical protein LAO08_16845 [Acidobacteriia bacterium]|nr:hypothetical protein [Terriglobia bacterium]
MGRTLPTFRQLIDDAIARWSKFRRALRREDQEYFDRLFRRVRSYTQAATYQASDNPMEAILLSIALDQEKRLDVLERTVHLPELSVGSTFTLDARTQLEPGSPPEAIVDCTFTLHASSEACSPLETGVGSTWSPPEEYLEQFDVPRSTDKNEHPGTHPQPDPSQQLNPVQRPNPGRQRHTRQQSDTTAWLDFRSLPEPARDEAVADRAEPKTPPAD